VLKDAFYGFSHFALAVALTALMVLMVVMFVIDIKTKYEKNRKRSKVTDGFIGVGWAVIVGVLVMNSWRSGLW